jgi:hypothetical protein
VDRDALDPSLDPSEAADFVYLLWSPDAHRILTVERGWTPEQYEAWLAHAARRTLLALDAKSPPSGAAAIASSPC